MSHDMPPKKMARSFALPKVVALQGIVLPKFTAGTLFLGVIIVYVAVCVQAALRM